MKKVSRYDFIQEYISEFFIIVASLIAFVSNPKE